LKSDMLNDLPRPVIFAHRGASAYAPENTLAAFRLAVEQGAHAIELDAKLTADGEVVVIHDPTVDRTTGGSGLVREHTLAELQALDAGAFFDETFRGERIPTLAEVFEAVGGQVLINVELTNYATPFDDLPFKVAELVQQFGLQDAVMCSSFSPVALRRFHQQLPAVPLGLLVLPGRKGRWMRRLFTPWTPHQALHPALPGLERALVERVHRQGRRVHVFTVNRAEDMRMLCDWGVDGILTDDPLLALQVCHHRTW